MRASTTYLQARLVVAHHRHMRRRACALGPQTHVGAGLEQRVQAIRPVPVRRRVSRRHTEPVGPINLCNGNVTVM